jgi:hypothetical protein
MQVLNGRAAQSDTDRLDAGISRRARPADVGSTRSGLRVAAMSIGDTVIYRGEPYILRGLEPMGLPARRADLEDPRTGAVIRVPLADVQPSRD